MSGTDLYPETRLVRSSRRTIHKRGCPRAPKNAVGWNWAEGKDDAEWLAIPWLFACKVCFPENEPS